MDYSAVSADRAFVGFITDAKDIGYLVSPRNGQRFRNVVRSVMFNRTPLVRVRKTAWKSALREWEWFMSGSNNVNDLHQSVRKWWQPWADKDGIIPFNYGEQFRRQTAVDPHTGHVYQFDQIDAFIAGIKKHPHSSRHVITTWLSSEMYHKLCPITNCHGTEIQALVNDDHIDLVMVQRSADLVCGVPHNWIQYWAFLLWLAHRTGIPARTFTWIGIDVHLYEVHLPMVDKIQQAYMSGILSARPNLVYTPTSDEFKADDFTLDAEYTPIITDPVEMVV